MTATFATDRYLRKFGVKGGADFTWHWLAGRALMDGENPYLVVRRGGEYELNADYLYPLPAAIVTAPFSWISNPISGAAVFAGCSTALFVIGASFTGWGRLAAMGGIPFVWAATSGQVSILGVAGVLVPGMGWLAILKPNIGLALAAYKPSRSMGFGFLVLLGISIILVPSWPREWLSVVRSRTTENYGSPFLQLGGPLMSLSLLRWKRREARLLLVMAIVPQSLLFYDQLPLALVAKSRTESMLLVITGFVGYAISTYLLRPSMNTGQVSSIYGPAIVLSLFLPCLVMVLRRPNEASPDPRDN